MWNFWSKISSNSRSQSLENLSPVLHATRRISDTCPTQCILLTLIKVRTIYKRLVEVEANLRLESRLPASQSSSWTTLRFSRSLKRKIRWELRSLYIFYHGTVAEFFNVKLTNVGFWRFQVTEKLTKMLLKGTSSKSYFIRCATDCKSLSKSSSHPPNNTTTRHLKLTLSGGITD